MSQQASLTLNSVVYTPAGSDKGILFWYNRTGGVANSFSPVTQGYAEQVGQKKRTKVTFRVEVPTVAAVDSAYARAGDLLRMSSFQFEYWLDPTATLAERTDIVARALSLAGSSLVSDAVKDLNPAYA